MDISQRPPMLSGSEQSPPASVSRRRVSRLLWTARFRRLVMSDFKRRAARIMRKRGSWSVILLHPIAARNPSRTRATISSMRVKPWRMTDLCQQLIYARVVPEISTSFPTLHRSKQRSRSGKSSRMGKHFLVTENHQPSRAVCPVAWVLRALRGPARGRLPLQPRASSSPDAGFAPALERSLRWTPPGRGTAPQRRARRAPPERSLHSARGLPGQRFAQPDREHGEPRASTGSVPECPAGRGPPQ